MAKFIYRMQNILNLKLKLEEQQKMEFAAARKLFQRFFRLSYLDFLNSYVFIHLHQRIPIIKDILNLQIIFPPEREHKQAAGKLKNVLATYNEAEDLINIGAYKNGSNPNIDYAIEKIDAVNAFLICISAFPLSRIS